MSSRASAISEPISNRVSVVLAIYNVIKVNLIQQSNRVSVVLANNLVLAERESYYKENSLTKNTKGHKVFRG